MEDKRSCSQLCWPENGSCCFSTRGGIQRQPSLFHIVCDALSTLSRNYSDLCYPIRVWANPSGPSMLPRQQSAPRTPLTTDAKVSIRKYGRGSRINLEVAPLFSRWADLCHGQGSLVLQRIGR